MEYLIFHVASVLALLWLIDNEIYEKGEAELTVKELTAVVVFAPVYILLVLFCIVTALIMRLFRRGK